MDPTRKEKLKRFASDRMMFAAVREQILSTYLRPRAKLDVQVLAAERLAIDLLEDAFKEIERFRVDDEARPERTATHV